MRSRWSLAVLALYVATASALVAVFASTLVATLALFGPVPIVVLVPFYLFFALDWVGLDARTLSPLVVVAAAVVPFVAVGAYARTGRSLAAGYPVETQQVAAATLGLVALVAVALPGVVRWYAWRQFGDATVDGPSGADALASIDAREPDRLSVRTVDDTAPGAYLVDDGHTAVLGLTTGARDALDDRERDAVLAREVTRTVDRAAVPAFWASALALAAGRVVRPISTPRYDSRAGGKVRLPYRFVAPLKIVSAVLALFLGYVVGTAALSALAHVNLLALALGYAAGTVAAGFAVTRAADRLAQAAASEHVLAADAHGAILADDSGALASALRTLHATDDPASAGASQTTANTDPHVIEDERDALAALVDCPTDRVPLDERLDALDQTPADGPDHARRESTTANTSS